MAAVAEFPPRAMPPCVILAGGRGTRISEESALRPKPMVEIGNRPILWHIMKIYAHFGVSRFIVCLGYRGYMVKEYFLNYWLHGSDVTVRLDTRDVTVHQGSTEPWEVTLVDTGEATSTGGRLKRAARYLPDGEPFFFTYGDGLANVDIAAELDFHRREGGTVTMTVVRPPARFGTPKLDGSSVTAFLEKNQALEGYVNGGFFVVDPVAVELIEGDETPWEGAPLQRLAKEGSLRAFRHEGFWQPMDTLRDKELLNELWAGGDAPWKLWG
jgi:glucose-1-phosphate cytidylyltransferase